VPRGCCSRRPLAERHAPAVRARLLGASGASGLYLASVAIVTVLDPLIGAPLQPAASSALGLHQQSQVALSAFWTVAGVMG
jgi:hypothetical protein